MLDSHEILFGIDSMLADMHPCIVKMHDPLRMSTLSITDMEYIYVETLQFNIEIIPETTRFENTTRFF